MNADSDAWALLAACTVLAACVFLNVDGYQTHLVSPWGGLGEFAGEPPQINWSHGWPVGFAVRSSIYSVNAGRGVRVVTFRGDYGYYSRWPIDESPVVAFSRLAAVADLLICMALIFGTFVGTGKLARRLGLRLRFGIRSLLMFIFVLAIVLAVRHWIFASRYLLQFIAFAAAAFGASMCLIAICLRAGQQDAACRPSPSTHAT